MKKSEKQVEAKDVEWDLHNVEVIVESVAVPLEFDALHEKNALENSIEEVNPVLFGLEPVKATEIKSGLTVCLAERQILEDAYIDVITLPVTVENLETFKELRLKIRDNRTKGIEVWHKREKEFYLSGGRFVDAIKNKEVAKNVYMESKLKDAEQFFENQEKERKQKINLARLEELRPYVEDTIGLDFSEMSQEDFEDFLVGKKTRWQNNEFAKQEEARIFEEERLAEEKRQEEIRLENERLKKEADAKALFIHNRNGKLLPYLAFIRDINEVLNLSEEAFEKELISLNMQRVEYLESEKAKAVAQEEAERAAKAKADALELELKTARETEAKRQAEEQKRIAKENAEADAKAKLEAEQKAQAEADAKRPEQEQLLLWIKLFELPKNPFPENVDAKTIEEKFEAFKKWSINQILGI